MTNTNNLIIWPDDTWCFRFELEDYSHKSDDYYTLPFNSVECYQFLKEFAQYNSDEQ